MLFTQSKSTPLIFKDDSISQIVELRCMRKKEQAVLSVPENPINPMLRVHCCFQYRHGHGTVTGH